MNGVINFYKPKGMTSHDAVNYFRKLLNTKKVGHSGTLDPGVTGVLPICIGRGTRVAEYLLESDKEYVGELTLGSATDTQDKDGKIIERSSKIISESEIIEGFNSFKGAIEQKPPMYSALKHKGKKLYELAREGKTVERKSRKINIYELDIINNRDNKMVTFYIKCSKGTYVRTLCHDIGEKLNTKGHMSHLIRVGVGDFKIEDSVSMDYLNSISLSKIKEILHPVDYALGDFERLELGDSYFKEVTNGVRIPIQNELDKDSLYRVYCKDTFIGIGEIIMKDNEQYLKMKKVFA